MDQTVRQLLNIAARPEIANEELEQFGRQLHQELAALGVEVAGAGGKAGDPVIYDALIVTLAASNQDFVALINALQSWIARHERLGVTLDVDGDKLELRGVSSDEQRRLVNAWIGRHIVRSPSELQQILATRFSKSELRTLCFHLSVDHENLAAEAKADTATELVAYLERRQRIPELVEVGKRLRPDIAWGLAPRASARHPFERLPRDLSHRAGLFAVLGLALLLGVGLGLWQLILIKTTTPVEPTTVSTAVSSVAPATAASADPAPWLTSTPLVPLPLPVALEDEGCAGDRARLEEDVRREGGVLVKPGDAQLRIEMQCVEAQTGIQVHFPERSAYRVEFLDEAPTLAVETELAYGRVFIQAAVAYASGDYVGAVARLEQVQRHLPAPDAYLLHAQTLVHLERWKEARKVFTALLDGWPAAETATHARAYAGRGLTYLLELDAQSHQDGNEDVLDECMAHAPADYDKAVAAQPDRALWRVGRALARLKCSEDDLDAIRADVTEALRLSEGDGSVDEALALSVLASFMFFFDEHEDRPQAILKAEQARDIAPELPSPYGLLSCFHGQENLAAARSNYREYVARLSLSWRQREAAQDLDGGYCPWPLW